MTTSGYAPITVGFSTGVVGGRISGQADGPGFSTRWKALARRPLRHSMVLPVCRFRGTRPTMIQVMGHHLRL